MAQRAEQYDADDGDPQGGADPLSGIDHAARGTGVLDRDAGEHQVGHQRRPSNLGATVLPEREDGQGRRGGGQGGDGPGGPAGGLAFDQRVGDQQQGHGDEGAAGRVEAPAPPPGLGSAAPGCSQCDRADGNVEQEDGLPAQPADAGGDEEAAQKREAGPPDQEQSPTTETITELPSGDER